LFLGVGVTFLTLQLFYIAQYTERLEALSHQHLLIDTISETDVSDPKMASILVNGAVAEIALSTKLSVEEGLLDAFNASDEEYASLSNALGVSSERFQNSAIAWSESLSLSKNSQRDAMINAKSAYVRDIDRMIDYQSAIVNESVDIIKSAAFILFLTGLVVFFRYRYRLDQIYRDIHTACSVDTDGSKKMAVTEEIDFILKRLSRKSLHKTISPNFIHPMSGLNNQKGLINAFNAKKGGRGSNTIFLALFEIDHYTSLVNTLSKENIKNLFKKLGEMISMYEQPHDVIAQMDDDRIVFFMSRNSKRIAFEDCEKILHIVENSSFHAGEEVIKITLSAGFLLKIPVKSVEEAVEDALKLVEKAKGNGGNRVAQQYDHAD
jgi:GGDEF domain-containing protein